MNELPTSALIMLVSGAVVCYGGVAYFVYRALKGRKRKTK